MAVPVQPQDEVASLTPATAVVKPDTNVADLAVG